MQNLSIFLNFTCKPKHPSQRRCSDIEIPDDALEEIGNIPNTAWDAEYWRKGLDPSVEMPMEADVDGDCTLVDIDTQAV